MEYLVKLSEWEREGQTYRCPAGGERSNWYMHGFVPKHDGTVDLYGWYGFVFETEIHGVEEIEITVETLEFKEGRDVEVTNTFVWRAAVAGEGRRTVTAELMQFDLFACEPNVWKYVRSVTVNREVSCLRAVRAAAVAACSEVMSKPAQDSETVVYEIELANCTEEKQAVSLSLKKRGWETLACKLVPENLVLAPMQTAACRLEVSMNDRVAPGGFEQQVVKVIPNGDGAAAVELVFDTVKYLPHPYLAHTEDGWRAVQEKAERYDWANKILHQYIADADGWEIPPIDPEKPYLYITESAHRCYNAAIVWKLTGERRYAEKAAAFLRTVADREHGYPKTLRACHQQMVHEGEFFKSCAFAYDLLCGAEVFDEADHADIQHTFRMFAWRIDWEISGGGISNWSLAMIAGAMYCSMCLQDRVLIERFLSGTGGIADHMTAGVLPDGWWCECTIGYNQMAAGLFSEYTQALLPWGVNLKEMWFPAQYARTVQPRVQHVDGLSWDIYGGGGKNYRCIKDLWDSLVAMADYRGVVIGVNDSAESKFGGRSGVAFDSRYDIAYTHYGDPAYAVMVKKGGEALRDLLHGVPELPETAESELYQTSCCFDNGGVSVLRSQTEGREARAQYQGSLKYGSHGGAHGHYDRCAMNALSRFGKNFYNPENVWYAYGTLMYKFYVQNSINHNMVTADFKLQDPAEGKNLLFYAGKMMQANAAETTARWSNPPYGGWRILLGESFAERTWNEGRYVPIPENAPEYTSRTAFTEPIVQRRLLVVMDEYAVNFDYVAGEAEHDFACIYHAPGLRKVSGAAVTAQTEQLTEDPLSSAQFITDCSWYRAEAETVRVSFEAEFNENHAAKPIWFTTFRSGYNEPGRLGIDIYYAGAAGSELVIGGDPEYAPVNKRLTYRVEADGEEIAGGRFGAWILGREQVSADISGKKELKLFVRAERAFREVDTLVDFEKTIFWGDPYILTKNGEKRYLAELPYTCTNVDTGNGVGRDYFGGDVTIQAKRFEKALPSEPLDSTQEAVITLELADMDAVRFEACIGGDYPLGDGRDRRRLIAQRKRAKQAAFVSVLELYETERRIADVTALGENGVMVTLKDGTVQKLYVKNLDCGEEIQVLAEEYKDGTLVRSETTERECESCRN